MLDVWFSKYLTLDTIFFFLKRSYKLQFSVTIAIFFSPQIDSIEVSNTK